MRDDTFQILNDIYAERMRQESAEGFTPEHDDGEVMAELGRMAASYTLSAASESLPGHLPIRQVLHHRAQLMWPVVDAAMKPHPPRRAYVIAAALLMAEIERIDRRDGYRSTLDETDAASRRFARVRNVAALTESPAAQLTGQEVTVGLGGPAPAGEPPPDRRLL